MKIKSKILFFCLTLMIVYSFSAMAWAGKIAPQEYLQTDVPPNVPIIQHSEKTAPIINATGAILLDAETGSVLYQKNGFQLLPPASTTKILTALLVLDMDILAEETTVSGFAAAVGESSANLQTGEIFTVESLLKGALVKSANDTCFALGEALAGSEPLFVHLMNIKAETIGAYDAVLANTNGLPAENHYLSAYDLALIARENLCNQLFREIVSSKYLKMTGGNYTRSFKNTNKLLWQNQYVIGIKTGTTDKAGQCLVSAMNRNGRTVIAVVLNSPDRFRESLRLLNYGIDNFQNLKYIDKDERAGFFPLKNSHNGSFCLTESAGVITIPKNENIDIDAEYHWEDSKNHIKAGETLGTLVLKQGKNELQYVNLQAETTAKTKFPFDFWHNLKERIKRIFV